MESGGAYGRLGVRGIELTLGYGLGNRSPDGLPEDSGLTHTQVATNSAPQLRPRGLTVRVWGGVWGHRVGSELNGLAGAWKAPKRSTSDCCLHGVVLGEGEGYGLG